MRRGAQSDPWGFLAIGSIIVNIAQESQKRKLLRCYDQLRLTYETVYRRYLALRSLNEALQRQNRECEALIDRLSREKGELQKQLLLKEGTK